MYVHMYPPIHTHINFPIGRLNLKHQGQQTPHSSLQLNLYTQGNLGHAFHSSSPYEMYRKLLFPPFPMKMSICCKYTGRFQCGKQPVKVEHVLFSRKQCGSIQQHNLV